MADYKVLASFGHVRDLPPEGRLGAAGRGFRHGLGVRGPRRKQVGEIAHALKGASRCILATDPDREGEAISWHVQEMLAGRGAEGRRGPRITFNEITKRAVQDAMAHPRDLDMPLIDAYLARRALDYLVGFTLSPVLWRKLPGSRSAGRVQSVALRLICEREAEIEAFRAAGILDGRGRLHHAGGAPFTARLTHLDGKKLEQFDLPNEASAMRAKARSRPGSFQRRLGREEAASGAIPPPPFTTSTLQQEASRKLGFGAQQTMRTAQQLYEGVDIGGETVGLITYMRTDGVQMAREAIAAIRDHVEGSFGDDYLPAAPRDIPDQGEERPGSARGDPPDRCGPHAGERRALPRCATSAGSTS